MKKNRLKQFIICTLICSSLVGFNSVKASAKYLIPDSLKERAESMDVDTLYKNAYIMVKTVQKIGSKYDLTPRYSDNYTSINSNSLPDLIYAVRDDHMQEYINEARYYMSLFPDDIWKSKNTFSHILDGYQQPSYEYIVEIADKLLEYTKKDVTDFDISTNWDKKKRNDFIHLLVKRQNLIEMGRTLNNDIDPAYSVSYSSALDISQQRILDLVTGTLNRAKKTKVSEDIDLATSAINTLKQLTYFDAPLQKYSLKLEADLNKLKKSVNKQQKVKLTKEIKKLQKEVISLKTNFDPDYYKYHYNYDYNNYETYIQNKIDDKESQIIKLQEQIRRLDSQI